MWSGGDEEDLDMMAGGNPSTAREMLGKSHSLFQQILKKSGNRAYPSHIPRIKRLPPARLEPNHGAVIE